MKLIYPSSMPIPKGHYSPATVHNGVVYVSGQLPFDQNGNIQLGSFEEQARLCLQNMETILIAAKSSLQNILKLNVYLSNIEDWPAFNKLYKEIMGDHKPARAIVPCSTLHYGCSIEMDCIAVVDYVQ